MRLVPAFSALLFASPAFAADVPSNTFSPTWATPASQHFSAWDRLPSLHIFSVHVATIPANVVDEALTAATKTAERRDLAVDEIASGWEPARRTALEDLRDAQRAYAAAAGGDSDARGQRFVALLKQVVDGSGRSVAQEPSRDGDGMLSQVYDRVIRDASDSKLAGIEASETAWVAYRDAFDRFALAMDRPDAAKAVRDDLARHRADELQAVMDQ